jgi:hypothetical protein
MDTQVNPPLTPHEVGPKASALATPKHDEQRSIQHALDQVLSSPFFRNTHQCQNLLRYIVRHSIAGEDHLLRERVIGSEVFGRRPDYEPGEDPVVRLRASEVRKRLAQYYHSVAESPDVHIEIPAGSYKAVFGRREETLPAQRLEASVVPLSEPLAKGVTPETVPAAPERHDLVAVPEVPVRVGYKSRSRIYGPLAVVVLVVCVIAFAPLTRGSENMRFRTFWAPWIDARKPIIIAIGSNAVYRLADPMMDNYARTHGLAPHGEEFFVPLAPNENIRGSDLVPAENSFVALGDVASVSHLVASITRQKQSFQERFPNDISFAELRNSPSILVGGFNNPMTIELTKKLRFVLRARNEIDDTQDANRRWVLNASIDSHDTEDYAIITRVVNGNSGDAPMMSVAGMGQYGTLAAADFICDPAGISSTVRNLPDHWQTRNLQLILHVKVADFKVAATDVVAVHTW